MRLSLCFLSELTQKSLLFGLCEETEREGGRVFLSFLSLALGFLACFSVLVSAQIMPIPSSPSFLCFSASVLSRPPPLLPHLLLLLLLLLRLFLHCTKIHHHHHHRLLLLLLRLLLLL